jgi:flagellar biosynthesis anti-sigma factor FlgM
MKIEGNSPNPQALAANRVESVRSDRSGRSDRASQQGDDSVALSADAQLISQAMRAAEGAPAIRHEQVERARQRLAAGEVGKDLNQLADRLIDHLLEK